MVSILDVVQKNSDESKLFEMKNLRPPGVEDNVKTSLIAFTGVGRGLSCLFRFVNGCLAVLFKTVWK